MEQQQEAKVVKLPGKVRSRQSQNPVSKRAKMAKQAQQAQQQQQQQKEQKQKKTKQEHKQQAQGQQQLAHKNKGKKTGKGKQKKGKVRRVPDGADDDDDEVKEQGQQQLPTVTASTADAAEEDAVDNDNEDDDDFEANDLQLEATADMQALQCDVRACCPGEEDFWGIKQLLHQLMRDGSFVYGDLADSLIENNACSTVIKPEESDQSGDVQFKAQSGGPGDDDADDDDDGEVNRTDKYDVFAIAGVIPLSGPKAQASLTKWLAKKCSKQADVVSALKKPGTAFVICERIINLPPQLATAMYDTLLNDMLALPKADRPKQVVMMFKAYEYTKKTKTATPSGVEFYGPEDTFFFKSAASTHRFNIPKTSGQLQDSTQPDKMYRVVCVLSFKAFRAAAQQVASAFVAQYDGCA
ncbi:hypothetical protein PTSG_04744 [Salpingoeca rosetta]|uniref:Uncharacterized protein n=1 Tax=Salpingoeca rosetta (strain ATCC 50818 / BSB-021) TaxID=946362 RepID=F2U9K6_SALR5|nr:uncharacterized protein PTSG_04744 [Salpingoeca rosetta]EGD73033.1 hypothetical protein PTSG_04744 [Salpingoeca rosetta]|eukprot:XP_004994064.1 hypothetical protein PTSG_04744 [Salpingoeca rosetta]